MRANTGSHPPHLYRACAVSSYGEDVTHFTSTSPKQQPRAVPPTEVAAIRLRGNQPVCCPDPPPAHSDERAGGMPSNVLAFSMVPTQPALRLQKNSTCGLKASLSPSMMPTGMTIAPGFLPLSTLTGLPHLPQKDRFSTSPDSGVVSIYVFSTSASDSVYLTCYEVC